jgi:hypothetical protein
VDFAHKAQPEQKSIVCLSMLKALQGVAGDHEVRPGASVWLNPLMTVYWFFDLQAVYERHLFAASLGNTRSLAEVVESIQSARGRIKIEDRCSIPV